MKKIKTILIGFGKMGKGLGFKDKTSHFGVIKYLNSNFLLLNIIKKKKKNIINSNLEKLRPQLVVVSVSNKEHYSVCKEILNCKYNPKVIFLEKPSFETILQLNEILYLSKKKKTKIIINQTYRFSENSKKLKKQIRLKDFGKIKKISINYTNGLKNNCVHSIDFLYYLFGQNFNFKVIKSWKNTLTSNSKKKMNYDFYMYDKKKQIILEGTSFNNNIYEVFDIDLYFEKVKISIENYFKSFFIQSIELDKFRNKELKNKKEFFKYKKDYPLINAYDMIIRYIQKNINIKNFDLENNKKTIKTILEIEKNAKS